MLFILCRFRIECLLCAVNSVLFLNRALILCSLFCAVSEQNALCCVFCAVFEQSACFVLFILCCF